ncbi:MAG TPA: SLC13 family permease [Gaiellaceae bacterium]
MTAHHAAAALRQTWPPFVLVAGLLLIGAVAAADDLFEAVGARVAGLRIGAVPLLLALLAVDAVVTVVLNLDTAVVFLTPVLLHGARRRGLSEAPFLYGCVFMANASSTLLPGSNLTNLLVLGRTSGTAFAGRTALPWLVSVAITAAFVAIVLPPRTHRAATGPVPPLRIGVGLVATVAAAVAVLVLHDAALPVLAIGVVACLLRRVLPRLDARVPAVLFVVAVALGTLARAWNGPAHLLATSGRWTTGALAAGLSVLVNNLPAAVLLSAQPPPHPIALLLGLDLGPNLAVTGALSAVLWWQAARAAGTRPSIVRFTVLGVVLTPLTLAASLALS